MATTHVFIVDTITFKLHLEYLFCGTGSRDDVIDFNNKPSTSLRYQKENALVGMIADSQRIRKGDFIIFYLQANARQGLYEGKFYGIFKAKEDYSFLDNNDEFQYLYNFLGKSLTFRTLLEPFEVFAKGVTEWEALDEIRYLNSPCQMLWSLIYRKLKGNRGNTMITIYESDRLFKLLRDKNNKKSINAVGFSFDISKHEIIPSTSIQYEGRKERIDIFPRLKNKYDSSQAFETHLQAYIMSNLGRSTNASLDNCLLQDRKIEWIGNEMSCGVGMQRIDIALSLLTPNSKIIQAIELKAVEANPSVIFQIQRYVDWLEQYYVPNRISDVQPTIVSKKIEGKDRFYFTDLVESFRIFNSRNENCYPIKYIEYEIINNSIIFREVKY